MLSIYVKGIIAGLISIEEVPPMLRDKVEHLLQACAI